MEHITDSICHAGHGGGEYPALCGTETAHREDVQVDDGKLASLDGLIEAEYQNIHGIVAARRGFIVYERYFGGFAPSYTHDVASVTKSVLSALIGIALDKGYIESIEQPVLAFFPQYTPRGSGNKKAVTIRNLLTMTAPWPFPDWQESFETMCGSDDWVSYILDMMGEGEPGGRFKYSTGGAHLLSAILTRVCGKNAREFANEFLCAPAGMNEIPEFTPSGYDLYGSRLRGWVRDPSGNSTGGWGLRLSALDMARFGLLYLNKGAHNGVQVVPEAWIEESTRPNANNYGYLWWLGRDEAAGTFMAMGDGGNVICCVPEKELVIAIASGMAMEVRDRMPLIEEIIKAAE